MLALALDGVVKRYHAGVPGCLAGVDALRGVTLDVQAGELVALVGAPGAGKSTLLLCAAGLVRPDAGSVSWFGRTGPRPAGLAYVPERAMHYPFLTAREVIEHHSRLSALPPGMRQSRVEEVLRLAALQSHASSRVSALAPGAARRLDIAQALVGKPRLLLIDEPFAGIDGASQGGIAELILAAAQDGMSVVIASREVRPAAGSVMRIVVMSLGRIHRDINPARLPITSRVAEARGGGAIC